MNSKHIIRVLRRFNLKQTSRLANFISLRKKKYEIDHDDRRDVSPTVERDDLAVTSKLPREKIQRYNAWVIERDNEKSSLLWFKTQFVGRRRASVQRRPYAGATLYVRQEVRIHTAHRKKKGEAGRAIKKGRKESGVKAKRAKQFKAIRPRCCCPLWPRRFIVAGANDRKGTREMLECITAYFTRGCTSQGGS